MENQRLKSMRRRLDAYYEAEEKILKGQSYTIGSRELKRADLTAVQKEIKELEVKIEALETRGTTKRRLMRVVPRG